MDRTAAHTAERTPARSWWLLLLPASYLLHIGEELWGGEGFAAWTSRITGAPMSETRFLVVNAVLWPLSAVLTTLGIRKARLAWLPVALATIVTVNAALHTLGTVVTGTYSPGLVTSLLLYFPIGGAALVHGRRAIPAESFRWGVIAGFVVHALVVVIAAA